ncbi:dead end protein 1-like [Aplochiton taeniatus]
MEVHLMIPGDIFEDTLIPLFSEVGPLWEFRLMMNYNGHNRGFAFAKYDSPKTVEAAIRQLHGHQLRWGWCLCVQRSIEKRQLCLQALPPNIEQEELQKTLEEVSEGLEEVYLEEVSRKKHVSAMAVYSNHHTATIAVKLISKALRERYSTCVTVKWYHSTNPSSDDVGRPSDTPPPERPVPPSPRPHQLVRPPPPSASVAEGRPVAPSPPQISSAGTLRQICKQHGGPPVYDLQHDHSGPDGLLCFRYHVRLPRLLAQFVGTVSVMPRSSSSRMWKDARCAVAGQVLQALSFPEPEAP